MEDAVRKEKFFQFDQNNSGGFFDVDDKVCHRIFIEANNASEAKAKALELGVYFDGVTKGLDCRCCGDRWSDWRDDDDAFVYPYEYDEGIVFSSVEEHAQYLADRYGWTVPDVRIYYGDGRVIEVSKKI